MNTKKPSWIDRYIAESRAKRAKESNEWYERRAQKDALEEKKFFEKHKDDWLTMMKLTSYDRTIGCDKTLHQYETPPHRNRPNAKRQPIKVQNYREMHNIPPDTKISDYDARKAYVGNIEFLLPERKFSWREKYYSYPSLAVQELQKTTKGTGERRALIHYMVSEGLVRCKESYLYSLLDQPSKHDRWPSRSRYTTREMEVKVDEKYGKCTVGSIQFELPFNGTAYTKREALNWIAKTTKRSRERGAMVNFMVDKGYVLCNKRCLYKLIKAVEDNQSPVGSDEWGARGRPKKESAKRKQCASEVIMPLNTQLKMTNIKGSPTMMNPSRFRFDGPNGVYEKEQLYDDKIFGSSTGCSGEQLSNPTSMLIAEQGDGFDRDSLLGRRGWKGKHMLRMIPVKFCDNLESLFTCSGPISLDGETIDICTYIGKVDSDLRVDRALNIGPPSLERVYRLYFPPRAFPPPENLNDMSQSANFARVRDYLYHKNGMKCIGYGGGNKNERIFKCKSPDEQSVELIREKGKQSCPYGFTVRWDKYGFYIHLLCGQNRSTNCGCPWHCCKHFWQT